MAATASSPAGSALPFHPDSTPNVEEPILIQRFILRGGGSLNQRIGITDGEWAVIGRLLPAERGRGCRPAQDNRRYFEGMLWVARTGSQWRQLPGEYGKWNSVYQRFRRWALTGVWDGLLQTLAELAKPERRRHMIDITIVRAHQNAAGVKGGIKTRRLWAAAAEASRPKSMPAATARAGRSASRSPADKSTTAKRSSRSCVSSKRRSKR